MDRDPQRGLFSEPDIDTLVHIIGSINTNANFPAPANDPGIPDGTKLQT